jgi:hypothetical protein
LFCLRASIISFFSFVVMVLTGCWFAVSSIVSEQNSVGWRMQVLSFAEQKCPLT